MAALDKLSSETVKELEEKAKDYPTFELFEAEVRVWAGNVWNGEPNGLSDGANEDMKALDTQYDSVLDFENEAARYAELAWSHARVASDPGPQANAHLTGTSAAGDSMPGDPNVAPWAEPVGTEEKHEAGIVTEGEVDSPKTQVVVTGTDQQVSEPEPAKSYE